MEAPLGGEAGDPGAPTINAKKMLTVDPWEAVPKIRECPPSTQKMLTVAPWEAMSEIRERPPSMQKTSTVGPLGGIARGPRALTIGVKNVDGRPSGPRGGPFSIQDPKGMLQTCMGMIDKK
jgi:hypothetical protein